MSSDAEIVLWLESSPLATIYIGQSTTSPRGRPRTSRRVDFNLVDPFSDAPAEAYADQAPHLFLNGCSDLLPEAPSIVLRVHVGSTHA